ncbi:hypothetical protein HDF10_001108 [Edaphobacter lichenicola]|uniref:Zinc finger CHC2-type domain-containing protein n=1 Tax=Tunturiibacter lichenicola TaxID=2051959 RepID=A0A7W8N370_9BACT|nr:hypothetical protein [Edaphobacter lichenicola]
MIDKDAVKLAADPSIYQHYLPNLSQSGPQRNATCPFHNDSHPCSLC